MVKRTGNLNPAQDQEPVKRVCPSCGHHKAWPARNVRPCYSYKCCKCGKWER